MKQKYIAKSFDPRQKSILALKGLPIKTFLQTFVRRCADVVRMLCNCFVFCV